MRASSLPAPLLFLLLLQTGSSLAIDNDFSSYPEGAQQCLYSSADDAGCSSGSSGAELNQCLCKNKNNFVYNTASCVGEESPSDAEAVYETLSSNCAGTGVTLSVPKQAFLAAANPTTSTSGPTRTSTSTSTDATPTTTESTDSPAPKDPASTDDGLSTGTKIGIGVGVGFGVIAAALAAWFIWSYRRRRRSAHSIHSDEIPGGVAGPYGGAGAFGMANAPRHEYAQDNGQQGAAELASAAWKPSPGYPTTAYGAGDHKKDGVAGVPLLAELGNESASRQTPVELPASPGYLGYHDPAAGQRAVTPEGLSPVTYSQSGRGDTSPYTPSQTSQVGTYQ